jgi:hypothetical protein
VVEKDLAKLLALERTGNDRFLAAMNDKNIQGEIFGGQ